MTLVKQRPPAMPAPTYTWQLDADLNQGRENIALLKNHLSLIEKNTQKLKEWQRSVDEQSKKPFDAFVYERNRKIREEIDVEKSGLTLGLERLKHGLKLTGELLYSTFKDINNDYIAKYLSLSDYRLYLKKYKELLKYATNTVLFSIEAVVYLKKEIAQYLPQEKIKEDAHNEL